MEHPSANTADGADLEDFLRRIDELEAVVKGDVPAPDLDMEAKMGGVRLENKPPVNRTVINYNAFKDDPAPPIPSNQVPQSTISQDMSQDGFMRAVERDSKERAERRRKNMKTATEWKDRGNVEFKAGNFEKAIELYTEGLTHLKDFGVLYTNRAQAYNKVGKYPEAIADCDLILRLEPKNSKAYIHRGKALLGQLKYDEAIESYREILKYDAKQEKLVQKYVSEADQARAAATAEAHATEVLAGGDRHANTLREVLDKLWKPDQNLMYYAGGMRVLRDMIQDDTARTLFRTGKGFDILNQAHVQRCISRVTEGKKKAEAVEVTQALLDLLTQVVIQNDENCHAVMKSANFPAVFLGLLGCGNPGVSRLCIDLLLRLTESSPSRQRIIATFDNASLLVGLLAYVQTSQAGSTEAAQILTNLALEKRFSSQFRNKVSDTVLPAFEKFLVHGSSSKTGSVFPACISFISNMAHDPVIRKQIAERSAFWEASITVLKAEIKQPSRLSEREEVVQTLLGMLMNISMETTQAFKDQSESLGQYIIPLVKSKDAQIKQRSTVLLARILPHSSQTVEEACKTQTPLSLYHALQSPDLSTEEMRAFSQCLAVFTQTSQEAQKQITVADPVFSGANLKCYLSLLGGSHDDKVVANMALSLGHCLGIPGVAGRLADSDIVKTLLARTDTTNDTIKQNCAITLAKLATSDERHLQRLRDLGGVGILHTCSQYALR